MKCFACESDFFGESVAWNMEKRQSVIIHGEIDYRGRSYTLCPRCMRLFLLATAVAGKQPFQPITDEEAEDA